MKSFNPLLSYIFTPSFFKVLISGLFCFNLLSMVSYSASSNLGLVKVRIDNGTNHFTTDIYFNTNGTAGLDPGYDASLFGGVAPSFSIYSLLVEQNTGMPFGIQTLGENEMNGITVPIGIHANQGDMITVKLTEITIPNSINIYLDDNLTGSSTLLNSGNYQFLAENAILDSGRFYLRFDANALSNDNQSLEQLNIFTEQSSRRLMIEGTLEQDTNYSIYSINGTKIRNGKLSGASRDNTIRLHGLQSGIYIVEMTTKGQQRCTEKFILK